MKSSTASKPGLRCFGPLFQGAPVGRTATILIFFEHCLTAIEPPMMRAVKDIIDIDKHHY